MRLRPLVIRTLLAGLILFGRPMMGFGAKALSDSQRFLATAAVANGVVVDVAKVREHDYDTNRDVARAYPVVQFATAHEQHVRFQPAPGSDPPAYRLGGSLRVLHDPANPHHVVLDTWDDPWNQGVVIVLVGVVLVAFNTAAYVLVRSERARHRLAGWLARGGSSSGRRAAG